MNKRGSFGFAAVKNFSDVSYHFFDGKVIAPCNND